MEIRRIEGVVVNDDGCAVDDLSFCGAVQVTVPAAVPWDDFVDLAVQEQWVGVEALSGVPGTVGEVVARNAAAYGQRVGDVVASVRTWDLDTDRQRTFAAADCGFTPQGSRVSAGNLRILDGTFLMRQGDLTQPIYDETLAGLGGVGPGQRLPLIVVREAILRAGLS
jgi:UDP-N-acetylmuramate dehydrogenase